MKVDFGINKKYHNVKSDDDMRQIITPEEKNADFLKNGNNDNKINISETETTVKIANMPDVSKLQISAKPKKNYITFVIFILLATILVRHYIKYKNEEQKVREVKNMLKEVKPLFASIYKLDEKVATGIQEVINSYNFNHKSSENY